MFDFLKRKKIKINGKIESIIFDSLENKEVANVSFPTICQSIYFSPNYKIGKNIKFPKKCGAIELVECKITEPLIFPKKCNFIDLEDAEIFSKVTMSKVFDLISFKNATLHEGIHFPNNCDGGNINLESCKIKKGFSLPKKCGNLYLQYTKLPSDFKFPEECGNVWIYRTEIYSDTKKGYVPLLKNAINFPKKHNIVFEGSNASLGFLNN